MQCKGQLQNVEDEEDQVEPGEERAGDGGVDGQRHVLVVLPLGVGGGQDGGLGVLQGTKVEPSRVDPDHDGARGGNFCRHVHVQGETILAHADSHTKQ